MSRLIFLLKVSRPGLWFATIWLYLLPTSQMDIWQSPNFWFGLFYICFPLNFLVYGWNDIVDQETDALNPRKDSFWFGAKGDTLQLQNLWKSILLVQLLCLPGLIFFGGIKILILLLAFVVINGLYNLPEKGLRSMPPLELICQIGYLLIVPLSILINDAPTLSLTTCLYLFLFAMQSHLIGEVMDIEPDGKTGRKTTAVILGMKKTKLIIIAIVAAEVSLLFIHYKEFIFGSMLLFGLIWLLLDLFFIYRTKTYTVNEMKLFGLLSNTMALVSMIYVWYSGCLS